jgi:hypothetical protein
MTDPREQLGHEVHSHVKGPFSVRQATRDGTGDDGGTLDVALVAHTEDGTRVIIGEIWAACPNQLGGKTRINAKEVADSIVTTLNGGRS